VSWFDATAFCRWLSARLGAEVRLPDEWEWQWAAQSARPEYAYPWGPEWRDGLANTYESGIGRTTAVGMHPGGRSLQGVYDLAGNVWEWCRNQYENPGDTDPGGDGSRVLRGGSWNDGRDSARAGNRDDYHPDGRVDDLGFRVVCSSPIR
jgi:formylglycine-generating enzyme required for sulfatase activity